MNKPLPLSLENKEARDPGLAMLRTLALVAGISGFLVVLTYQFTRPIITENRQKAIEKALFKVVPAAVTRRDYIVHEQKLVPASIDGNISGERIYAAYDKHGKLVGIALDAAIQGYQDQIRILYGYDPYCQCISGIEVLKMAETPGIGDKIAKDLDFLENFVHLDARLNDSWSGLAHAIVTVKPGSKHNPWEIEAITGATISSRAVGRMLDESGQRLLPVIMANLSLLQNNQEEGR